MCSEGFDPELNTFTQYYGGKGLDASLLFIPLGRLLAADRPARHRHRRGARARAPAGWPVLRFKTEADVDGLSGDEGVFLACSFWLAIVYQMMGRKEDARRLFERVLATATISDCSPRSTTRSCGVSSGTSHRLSAISRW